MHAKRRDIRTDAAAPVKKPLRADAQRNRTSIVVAAQKLFAAQGVSVEMDDVARAAGVGVGTVYRHFPTKEALFHAMVTGHIERLIELADSFSKAPDPGEAFFEFLSRFVEQGRAKRHLCDALSRNGLVVDLRAPGGLHEGVREEFRGAIAGLLARAQKAGAVRRDVGVGEVVALMNGVFSVGERGPCGSTVSGDAVFGVICDGLRGRPH